MIGRIEKQLMKKLSKRKLHFSLIDPDPQKASLKSIEETARTLERFGTDAVLVGGSTRVTESVLDKTIRAIKKYCSVPIILFPGNANGVSRHADAILFMSLMNSQDALWISGMQAIGAPLVQKYRIETLPTAYLIVEPGMKAGDVGRARVLKNENPEEAAAYALAAQYFGMRFVYLEAGSGAPQHVSESLIRIVKKSIEIPLIVGGGIRSADIAKKVLGAGADIIVTGTVLEKNIAAVEDIIKTVHSFR